MKFAIKHNGMELTRLNKTELEAIHENEVGPILEGSTKASLIDAIESARSAGPSLTIEEDAGIKPEEESGDFFDHVLTEADMDANPELAAAGLKAGDTVKVPKLADQDATYHDMFPDLQEDEMIVIKADEDGNLIDVTSMKKDAYAILPAHKFGWIPAPPKELA